MKRIIVQNILLTYICRERIFIIKRIIITKREGIQNYLNGIVAGGR